MIAAIIYSVAGILWGIYCARAAVKLWGQNARPILSFVLGALFWPVSMFIAVIEMPGFDGS